MSDHLDQMLRRLADAPLDHGLDDIEAGLGREIRRRAAESRAAATLRPVLFASVGMALAAGVTVGGMTAAHDDTPVRDAASALAPSTLLESGR
jgi:hypothetical protein